MTAPLPAFPQAWWIEPGRVLGGSFPGDVEPGRAEAKLAALAAAGVRRVVCLQPEAERGAGGRPFAPYASRLAALVAAHGPTLDWRRVPVEDMGVPTEAAARAALAALPGEGVAFVHCWGGHGRTGTVAGLWLRERGLDADAAFAAIAAARRHDARLAGTPSPQTEAQRAFVRAWRPGLGAL